MSFDLTINRVGAFSGLAGRILTEAKFRNGDDLDASFRKLIDRVERDSRFSKVAQAILTSAKKHGSAKVSTRISATDCRLQPSGILRIPADFGLVPGEVREEPAADAKEHLVGLLPSQKFDCEFDGREWLLRVRVSFTACALEQPTGLTKFWISFEGIAADTNPDPAARPTEQEATKFIAVTDAIEREAMGTLHEIYRDALFEILGSTHGSFSLRRNRLRVSMADNDEEPVAALLDAMYFDHIPPHAILAAKGEVLKLPKQGLEQLEHLVSSVSESSENAKIDDETVSVKAIMKGVTGVVCQYDEREDLDEREELSGTRIVGFARRDGIMTGYDDLSPSMKRRQKEEDYVRSFSGARPLSAMLANSKATELERLWLRQEHKLPAPVV